MLISCPQCATSYEVGPAMLGASGRNVRCVRCQTQWFAAAPEPAYAEAEAAMDMAPIPAAEPEDIADDVVTADADLPPEQAPADAAAEQAETPVETPVEVPDGEIPAFNDAPSIIPAAEQGEAAVADENAFPITGGDIDTFVARRRRARERNSLRLRIPRPRWPLAALPTAILALVAATAVILGWRTEVVRLLPQTASLYSAIGLGVNLRGLMFENIKTSHEMHEGVPVMVVEGEIVSVSKKPVEVPRLRFGVRNAAGYEIYSWTAVASRPIAAPGERIAFRSRLASPPAEARDVLVRFFNRRDAGGLR
jgi:predicted Zn finger-like uncharacterized protein